MTWRVPVLWGLLALASILAAARTVGALQETLYAPHFLTGWVLALILGVRAVSWWRPPVGRDENEALCRRVHTNLWFGALLVFVFLVHVEMRAPLGWLETIVAAGFLALLSCTLTGGLIVHRRGVDAALLRRWLAVQIAIHWSLLGVALFHGVFTHLHGLLAHYVVPVSG